MVHIVEPEVGQASVICLVSAVRVACMLYNKFIPHIFSDVTLILLLYNWYRVAVIVLTSIGPTQIEPLLYVYIYMLFLHTLSLLSLSGTRWR